MMRHKHTHTHRFVRVLKLLRVLRLLRSVKSQSQAGAGGEVFRQVSAMVLTGLSLVFCFAGLIQVVETSGRSIEDLLAIWNQDTFYYHDALYFTIITISTVGYGDCKYCRPLPRPSGFCPLAALLFSLAASG
jgi:hypothetical protein